jgi:hypothetical protein
MAIGWPFGWQVENASGTPVSGAKIAFKKAGTSTNRAPFTDKGLTVPTSNPVVADAAGWFNVYLDPSLDYDITVKSADESITYQTLTYSGPGGDSVSAGRYAAAEYGIVADGTTETHVELQAAIDAIWLAGGGILELPEGTMVLGATIYVWQGVTLQGVGGTYNNTYSSTVFSVGGTAFKAKAALNADMLVFRYRPRAGEATPTGPSKVRHDGGMFDCVVWGNKSDNQAPTVTDTNTSGRGIVLAGVSAVHLDRVYVVRCAEEGIATIGHNYGGGSIQCNNMVWGDVRAIGNAENGFYLEGGDHMFGMLTAGYNGLDGIISACGTTAFARVLCWNNGRAGVRQQDGQHTVWSSIECYDNGSGGFIMSGSPKTVLDSYMMQRNGNDTGLSAFLRAGIVLGTGCTDVVLGDGVCADNGLYGGPFQQYGISVTDSANTFSLGNYRGVGNVVSDFNGFVWANIRLHPSISTNQPPHPGFVAAGEIDMNANNIEKVGWLTLGAPTAATVAAGVLSVFRTAATYSVAANNTVTDILIPGSAPARVMILLTNATSANTLTLTHNTAKIRCPDDVNFVLQSYESVWIFAVTDTNTIFQVVGPAV